MKTLISWILDINVFTWEGHSIDSLQKLRAPLDKEFDYVDNELSTMGFKNVVKRWFKTKRNIMEFLFQWLGF